MLVTVVAVLAAFPAGLLADRLAERFGAEWHFNDWEADDQDGEGVEPVLGHSALLTDYAWLRRTCVLASMILVFFLFAIRYQEPWQVTVLCVYSVALITCSMTDVIAHRIPDLVTYPAAGLSLIVMSSVPNTQLYDLISGAALFSGVLLVFYLLPGAGLGDAKLGVSAGLVLGLQSAYAALLVMAISGGIFAFAYLAATRFRTWKKAIPYGPHIAMGTIAVALANGVAFRTF